MKTQMQHFYEAHQKSAALNAAFLEMVNHPTNPMSREDLQALINRRPAVYGRFAGFLNKLPSEQPSPRRRPYVPPRQQHDDHVLQFLVDQHKRNRPSIPPSMEEIHRSVKWPDVDAATTDGIDHGCGC
jgi:hypothetical protein